MLSNLSIYKDSPHLLFISPLTQFLIHVELKRVYLNRNEYEFKIEFGCGAPPPAISFEKSAQITSVIDPSLILLVFNTSYAQACQGYDNWRNNRPHHHWLVYPIIKEAVRTDQGFFLHPSEILAIHPIISTHFIQLLELSSSAC